MGDELGVSSSDDKSILSGVILVLILTSQSSSGVVISLSLSSSLWLDLHSLAVCLGFNVLDESHGVFCF